MITESNKKYFVWIIVISVLLVYGSLILITQDVNNINLKSLAKIIPTTVTIELLFYWLFVKWGWKCKFLHSWLVVTPDLSGEWQGKIHYIWDGKEGERETKVKITQSFNHIVITLATEESVSRSILAGFDIDDKRGIYDLYYTYVNEPKITIQNRSAIHYGTTKFHFDLANLLELKGEYWTSRDTKGTIELNKIK